MTDEKPTRQRRNVTGDRKCVLSYLINVGCFKVSAMGLARLATCTAFAHLPYPIDITFRLGFLTSISKEAGLNDTGGQSKTLRNSTTMSR